MKIQKVCRDFLRMQKGRELDAIQAARLMKEVWGISVDHHEMSYALDQLRNSKEASITRPGGFAVYIIE